MGLIKMPSELEVKKVISVLIYGEAGIGKTTLGVSAPNAVLFDYDGGVQRINGAHRVPTLQVTSWEQTQEALDEIKNEMPEVQTIVIDTVGKLLDYMSAAIIRSDYKLGTRDGALTLKGYGVRKQWFSDFVKRITLMGKNVVFIAHEREDKQGEDVKKRPEISGSSANDLIRELDLVGYMYATGKKRTITFDPDERWYAKNTCNLPALIEVPTNIDANGVATGDNDFLSRIIAKYAATQEQYNAQTAKYAELIARLKNNIGNINNADEANMFVEEMKSMSENGEHIFNSKVVAARLFSERVSSLGLTYNKAKQQYEAA